MVICFCKNTNRAIDLQPAYRILAVVLLSVGHKVNVALKSSECHKGVRGHT